MTFAEFMSKLRTDVRNFGEHIADQRKDGNYHQLIMEQDWWDLFVDFRDNGE